MAYDPFLTTEQISAEGVLPVSLDELLEEADIVSMHLRLSDKTQKFFDREKFCKMKPTAFFINTARAGLVDEKALYDTLKNRRIAGAAIDVFTQEPLPVESPLLELENLTVTPHLAGYSCDTPRISTELIARELKNYCCGKPFIHSV